MFSILDTGASGLEAQRIRLDTIAANVSNMDTTHGIHGEKTPFRRRFVQFAEGRADDPTQPGVHVQSIDQDQSAFIPKHEPGNPDADENGWVLYPNIDLATETVNSLEASRAYEANVTMMETAKSMLSSSLRLLA